MKDILQQISALAIQLDNPAFTDLQIKRGWLGTTLASFEEIEAVERRLGVKLPDDYKNFLVITNGFFTPTDSTEPTFENIEDVGYLKNIDTHLLEIWNEGELQDIGEELNGAIVIGGLNDEQYFFLIPPDSKINNGNTGNLPIGYPVNIVMKV